MPREEASRALDRYEPVRSAEQTFDSLSGGRQTRLQILLLELGYITSDASGDELGETFVDLHELRPLPAAARSAECSPALPLGEPERLCRRVVTPSGLTVWLAGGGDVLGFVVAFPDATVVVSSQLVTDDDAALALVGRLKPVDAADLLDAAGYVFVP